MQMSPLSLRFPSSVSSNETFLWIANFKHLMSFQNNYVVIVALNWTTVVILIWNQHGHRACLHQIIAKRDIPLTLHKGIIWQGQWDYFGRALVLPTLAVL